MFKPDDVIVNRASYAKDPQRAMRSVVVRVYEDGRLLRYCARYNTKHIVERPELWIVVGRRGGCEKPEEAE